MGQRRWAVELIAILGLATTGCEADEDDDAYRVETPRRAQSPDAVWAPDHHEAPAPPPSPSPTGWRMQPSAFFSPDGRHVAVNTETSLWLVVTKSGALVPVPIEEPLHAAAFSPRGDLLAVRTKGALTVLRVPSLAHVADLALEPEDDLTDTALAWSPDGRRLLGDSGWVWDVASTERTIRLPLDGVASWTGDGRHVLVGGFYVRMLDVATGKEVLQTMGGCGASAVSSGGHWVAFASQQHELLAWTLGGKPYGPLVTARGCHEHHLAPSFTPDGKVLYSIGGNQFRAFESGTWRLLAAYDGPLTEDGRTTEEIVGVAPDGKTIVVQRGDRTAFLWDAAAMRRRAELDLAQGHALHGFSPDTRLVLSAGEARLQLLSATTGKLRLDVTLPSI